MRHARRSNVPRAAPRAPPPSAHRGSHLFVTYARLASVRSGSVAIYVHENVPGVTSDITPTSSQMREHPYLRLPRPRLVRHTIPLTALRQWTDEALKSLERA